MKNPVRPKKSTLRPLLAAGLLGSALMVSGCAFLASATDLERAEILYDKFVCTCSCNLQLGVCNMLLCPNREPMKQEIRAHLADGRSDEEVLDLFAEKYGMTVLSAPPKEGAFNLSAWLMPFVVLLTGAGVVGYTVRRFRGRWTETPVGTASQSSAFQERLERELTEYMPED